MRIDEANVRLRHIASVIIKRGVDYDSNKFDDKLKEGTLTLERTTAWISKAITKPDDIVAHFLAICGWQQLGLLDCPH